MGRGIETHNGYVQMSAGGINYIPSADPLYYGSVKTVKVGAHAYVITKGSLKPIFIWQSDEDVNDSDYVQMDTEDGVRTAVLMKGTGLIAFNNMTTGNGKGVFAFTGAAAGLFSVEIPAALRLSGNGSAIGIIADDNTMKGIIMKYISATKKLTFVNEAGEKNELTLA